MGKQAFTQAADWRNTRPITDAPSLFRRLRDAFRFEDGEPHEWRDVAVFLVGSAWGAMLAVGLLLAVRS